MIRKFIPGAVVIGLIASASAQPETADEVQIAPIAGDVEADSPAALRTDASYALGYQNGRQLASYGLVGSDLDQQAFSKGLLIALSGGSPEIDDEKLEAALNNLGELLQKRESEIAGTNLEAGKKFLAENAARDGVTTTKSGLQYEILTRGEGEKYTPPAAGEQDNKQFLVNYRGTLIDGTEFEASPEGRPVPMSLATFHGNGLIPAFQEALPLMPVGAKWKLFIPSELAYGEQRRGADIAPNSVLVFELELVGIEDAPAAPQGGFPFPLPEGD